ncbi:MAG: agmatinase [bacterium]
MIKTLPQNENFLGLDENHSNFEKAQAVILPIPYEGTTTYVKGTAKGPAAILSASQQIEFFDDELDAEPCKSGIATLPALSFARQSHEQALAKIGEAVKVFLEAGKFFVGLGGEHSITIPIVQEAVKMFSGLSVLQLDAHSDLRNSYAGSRLNHACVMARVNECCDFVSVGLRSGIKNEKDYIRDGAHLVYAKDMVGKKDWQQFVLDALSDTVYLTFDIDFFDPSIMPAVGTPEPGGFQWYESLAFLKEVFAQKKVVACDMVELCPIERLVHPSVLAAKLVYKLIGYKISLTK